MLARAVNKPKLQDNTTEHEIDPALSWVLLLHIEHDLDVSTYPTILQTIPIFSYITLFFDETSADQLTCMVNSDQLFSSHHLSHGNPHHHPLCSIRTDVDMSSPLDFVKMSQDLFFWWPRIITTRPQRMFENTTWSCFIVNEAIQGQCHLLQPTAALVVKV